MKSALICDVDAIIRKELKAMLNELGFDTIYECSTGEDAVISALDKIPDMVVMDISLPGKDGITTAEEIRKKLKIPIIFCTACRDLETLERATKAKIAAFLIKPLRKQDLWPAIELAFAHNDELEQLKEQIEDLKETLESRKVVEKAKGVLMRKNGLTETEAFRKMQKTAMDKRKSLRQVAEAILLID